MRVQNEHSLFIAAHAIWVGLFGSAPWQCSEFNELATSNDGRSRPRNRRLMAAIAFGYPDDSAHRARALPRSPPQIREYERHIPVSLLSLDLQDDL